ncbi:hypothetical protein [Actinoplanes nipponensis]|uniref:hypothetical protein n=1 Tax=Actinoplanes nipponensis TaxID=135950 RepID=UPI0031EDC396
MAVGPAAEGAVGLLAARVRSAALVRAAVVAGDAGVVAGARRGDDHARQRGLDRQGGARAALRQQRRHQGDGAGQDGDQGHGGQQQRAAARPALSRSAPGTGDGDGSGRRRRRHGLRRRLRPGLR